MHKYAQFKLSICQLQSAYRQFYSTARVLLMIPSDLCEAAESSCVTVLVAIDLSAAFDNIDHQVLVRRLEHALRDRPSVGRSLISRDAHALSRSVTPLQLFSTLTLAYHKDLSWANSLFSLFTIPLGDVISSFGVKFHQYADLPGRKQRQFIESKP